MDDKNWKVIRTDVLTGERMVTHFCNRLEACLEATTNTKNKPLTAIVVFNSVTGEVAHVSLPFPSPKQNCYELVQRFLL